MKTLLPLSLFALLCLSGCKGDLSLFGLGNSGEVVEATVDEKNYQEQLVQHLVDTEESALPVLKKQASTATQWDLQLVAVGVGLNSSFGIGPIKMGINPGIRAIFTNQTNPPPLP